uniref:hypothetical protein n=1 Tax=Clostridium sp. NkU-1 TaxID=1095009 RepID=UPI00326047B5
MEEANLAIKNKNILAAEKEPYVIAVYNEAAKGKIKGLVITEKFIYNLMNMISLSNCSIELEKISNVKVVNGNNLEIMLDDKKQIKWKLSDSMPLNKIVEGLITGLGLNPHTQVREANEPRKSLEASQAPKTVSLETNHLAPDIKKQKKSNGKTGIMGNNFIRYHNCHVNNISPDSSQCASGYPLPYHVPDYLEEPCVS